MEAAALVGVIEAGQRVATAMDMVEASTTMEVPITAAL